MAINLVVLDGVVKDMALKYDAQGKPECRFTLEQHAMGVDGHVYITYWPCCTVATAAERLASELTNGQPIVVTQGKLAYRKRTLKGGERSRIEVLVWQIEPLSTPPTTHEPEPAYTAGPLEAALTETPAPKGTPRYPRHLQQPWPPEPAH